MRTLAIAVVLLTGCMVGADPGTGGGGGGGGGGADAAGGTSLICPLPATGNTGTLTALKAQMCNVSGSQGLKKWYRMNASLTGTGDIVQIELWDGRGIFAGGTVHTGTFQLTGPELAYTTCGVCVRAIGGKATADEKSYFATGGTVTVTAIGAAGTSFAATITSATLGEVTAQNAVVPSGCSSAASQLAISGITIDSTGGGGGGGGGGGTMCPATIGD